MPRRAKYALMGIFALGGFTCIVSILRLESIYAASNSGKDASYNSSMAALWSSLEINTGILCSSLPTLRALVARTFPRLFASTTHRSRTEALGREGLHGSVVKKQNFTARHDELARDLSGRRDWPKQHAFASHASQSTEDEIGLDEVMPASPGGRGITVVTVVDQEVENRRARSETESERILIDRRSFGD
jgi:hypothetical protein